MVIWLAIWSLPLLLPSKLRVPVADDLGAYHLPLRSIYHSALQLGENWTWCPWNFCGYHVHGEGQLGGDHPLHQCLYRLLPLHWAFGLECLWAYPATFFGMWWWLRQMRFSSAASQVAGLGFSLCGFMTLRIVHVNAIQVIAHVPWLLGCLTWLEHRARRSTAWRTILPPLACSALLTGSQLLLGYPQYVIFTLIAEGLWLCSLMLRSPHVRRTIAVSWLTAKTLGLLLGAAQVLPTLEYLALSERVNWSAEQMFEGSWPALNLTQLVAPYLFKTRVVGQNTHELTIFLSSVTVCLAVLGLVNRPRHSLSVLRGFALTLCGVGLLLSLGEMSPLAALTPYIPVWNQFRFPCRTMLLFCLGMVLLAMLGWLRVSELSRISRQRTGEDTAHSGFEHHENLALGILAAITMCLPVYAAWVWPAYVNEWPITALGPICMIVTILQLRFAVRSDAKARSALGMLLALELLVYAMTASNLQQFKQLDKFPLPKLQHSPDRQFATLADNGKRILTTDIEDFQKYQNDSHKHLSYLGAEYTIANHARINGYAGVRPQKYLQYDSAHWDALRVAGVAASYSPGSCSTKNDVGVKPSWINCLDRGTLVSNTVLAENRPAQIKQLALHDTAIVESAMALAAPSPQDHLRVKLVTDRPGQMAFDLETNRDALLVTTESYHPGWHARVDGREMPVMRVNGDFLGVRIPAAAQRLECYFSDNWHMIGRWISVGSLVLLGLVFCWSRWRVAWVSCPWSNLG